MARRGDLTLDLTNLLPLDDATLSASKPSMHSAIAPLTPTPSPTSSTFPKMLHSPKQRFYLPTNQMQLSPSFTDCPITSQLAKLNLSEVQQKQVEIDGTSGNIFSWSKPGILR